VGGVGLGLLVIIWDSIGEDKPTLSIWCQRKYVILQEKRK